MTAYSEQIASLWSCDRSHSTTEKADHDPIIMEILRCGTLAPSSHNTQCWKFRVDDGCDDKNNKNRDTKITVLPDFGRRCSVVDPDDHHLYASLGCAVENIVIAARHFGYDNTHADASTPCDGIVVHLSASSSSLEHGQESQAEEGPNGRDLLYEAIFKRQCTRAEYDGAPLSEAELEALQCACHDNNDEYNGVQMHLYTDATTKQIILDHIIQANADQIESNEFMTELKAWVRFGESEAVATKDGLFGKCTGSPSIPRWIGKHIFRFVCTPNGENAKIKKQVESSAGFAVFVSEKDDSSHWVQAGRCYERFALQATALGIKNAFLNQPVEVAKRRPALSRELGLPEESRADLIARFGKGPDMPRSLRRPVSAVLISQ